VIQDIAAVVGVLVVLLPVLGYICMACYKSFKAFKLVSAIAEQFRTNGGGSAIDKINAISSKLDGMMAVNDVGMNLVAYPMFKADQSGHLYWANRQFTHDTGLSESELVGLGWLTLVVEEDRQSVRRAWLEAVADGRPVTIEFELEDSRYVILDALPVKSSRGLDGMLGTLHVERGYLDD
jgi:PAS domain S-box-containing protein